MENYVLKCENLTKKYDTKVALQNVSFSLERGKIVGLLGPNGSGKTTLIKLMNGLLVPTEGEIRINGIAPGYETKSMVSYLPDKNYLDDSMRVFELLSLFSDFYDDFDRQKAEAMLSDLGINGKHKMKTLSKGTKEKVQLVLVMSRKADLYLLDEPIGGVDPATRDYILNTIVKNNHENATVLISTHLIADVEDILDEVLFLKDGNVLLHETRADILEREGKSVDAWFREVFRC